jgi:hypothetical protein
LDTIALRVARKAWLRHAFEWIRQNSGGSYPGDVIKPPDIHGEFIPTAIWLSGDYHTKVEAALDKTEVDRQRIIATMIADSPLTQLDLTKESLLKDMEQLKPHIMRAGLAHTMAEMGLLPMFGMPTRVRNLYTGTPKTNSKGQFEWSMIDRDLDLAIHEFAPGSLLVKDKKIHKSVGFTPDLPGNFRPPNKKNPIRIPDPAESGPALSEPIWYQECQSCGASHWPKQRPKEGEERRCDACGDPLHAGDLRECREPAGFRTDFRPKSVVEEAETGGRHRTVYSEGSRLELKPIPNGNMSHCFVKNAMTFRINRGKKNEQGGWEGFAVRSAAESLFQGGLVLDRQYVLEDLMANASRFSTGQEPDLENFWLMSPKSTHALYLAPKQVHSGLYLGKNNSPGGRVTLDAPVRAAALSATFILVNRAALELDVGPEEFDVLEPRLHRHEDGSLVPLLQFTDYLINGAGFCAWLGEPEQPGIEPRVAALIRSIVSDPHVYPLAEFQKTTHSSCDESCYTCLRRYGNQAYHGLLDWRLGLSFLEMLHYPSFACGLDDNRDSFSTPSLRDWPNLAERYAKEMVRIFPGPGADVKQFGKLWAFRLSSKDRWGLVFHPLWNRDDPKGIARAALENASEEGHLCEPVHTFDLARRPALVREKLRKAKG